MSDTNTPASLERTRYQPYLEYKDSEAEWLGEIPVAWDGRALKYLATFKSGGTPKKNDPHYWLGDIPWVSPKDMGSGVINDSIDHITPEAVRDSSTRLVDEGAVLVVVRSGILKHRIPVAIAGREVALNQDIKALVSRGEILPRYLRYFIEGMQEFLLVEWRKEGATVESLETEAMSVTHIPVPPHWEQSAIGAFLDRETTRIDALVIKQEELIELLREKHIALITNTVTKGLDPDVAMRDSGVEWLGEIPVHWSVQRLKTISQMQSGESITAHAIEVTGPYPVFGGNGIRGYTANFTHDSNHILIGRQGAHCGNVRVARGRFWASEHAVVVTPDVPNVVEWCSALLEAMNLNRLSIAAAQPGLAVDRLREPRIPVPPVAEQLAIADFLGREASRINALIGRVNEAMDLLNEYRTALISAAVTGKIDVRGLRRDRVTREPQTTRRRG